jgi:hypothetical protein
MPVPLRVSQLSRFEVMALSRNGQLDETCLLVFYRIDTAEAEMVHKKLLQTSGPIYKTLKPAKLFPAWKDFLKCARRYAIGLPSFAWIQRLSSDPPDFLLPGENMPQGIADAITDAVVGRKDDRQDLEDGAFHGWPPSSWWG